MLCRAWQRVYALTIWPCCLLVCCWSAASLPPGWPVENKRERGPAGALGVYVCPLAGPACLPACLHGGRRRCWGRRGCNARLPCQFFFFFTPLPSRTSTPQSDNDVGPPLASGALISPALTEVTVAFERGRVVWPVGTPEGQTPRASRLSSGRPDHGGVQAVDLSRGLVASGVLCSCHVESITDVDSADGSSPAKTCATRPSSLGYEPTATYPGLARLSGCAVLDFHPQG
jgi:hypothetical protein